MFTSDTTDLTIPIAVHNDNILNGEREFFISIPALSMADRGGLHAKEVIPYHLQAYIEDDEGITVITVQQDCSESYNNTRRLQ